MPASTRGVLIAPSPLYWPEKNTTQTLTYALDMNGWLCAVPGDTLSTVSVTIPWTVSGDAQVTALAADDGFINVQVTGGLPGETYAVVITGLTTMGNGIEETALLPISAPFVEAGEPVPTPPSTVAATLTWNYEPSLDFSDPPNSMYL